MKIRKEEDGTSSCRSFYKFLTLAKFELRYFLSFGFKVNNFWKYLVLMIMFVLRRSVYLNEVKLKLTQKCPKHYFIDTFLIIKKKLPDFLQTYLAHKTTIA